MKSQNQTPENISNTTEVETNTELKEVSQQEESQSEQANPAAENTGDYSLEVIEDWDGKIDITYLEKKNPNYCYRYLKNDPVNLSKKTSNLLLQGGGWQICPRQHLLKDVGIKENKLSPDGSYRVGDLILAFIPRNLWEKKAKYKKQMADEPINEINQLEKEGDSSVSGIGHPDMKGIQTKESLRM